ncbi:hypothetical protein KVR01_000820 [Diaporthe batatas]|uniref:uncharacterized protein n=1 Tax=Diaporthe batatas TaxID=748121 RepID=UPI001D041EDE|nr:uncharacterized protein KVR01_000820 [Diaporthe batatas]KAG8170075.1 hypothetical protein KVR01_000820 [Diaporthe batatas]
MANFSKMSVTNASSPAQAAAFHKLKLLPLEVRLDIYKMAFQGAKVDAVLAMEDKPSGDNHHVLHLRHSAHFNLLLSCREIHDQALPTYWSEATLNLVQPYSTASPIEKICQWAKDSRYGPDYYSHHLCLSLPEVAKANVKHVRGMLLAPLDGDFVKNNPQLTSTAMLGIFKRLATCDISPTMNSHSDFPKFSVDVIGGWSLTFKDNTIAVAENGNNHRFKSYWKDIKCDTKDLLRKICGIDITTGVVFLAKDERVYCKSSTYESSVDLLARMLAVLPDDVQITTNDTEFTLNDTETVPVKQFRNLSAGVLYEVHGEEVGDEEGYDMVIHPAPDSLEESASESIGSD